jgi:hypothetical protein
MYLENVVFDAEDPGTLGRSWEDLVGGQRLTDEPDGFETRLTVEGGPLIDLCFQRVSDPSAAPPRLHVVLDDGGARYADTGPVAALRLESADPARDAVLWSWITGWDHVPGAPGIALRHPSGRGPVLELVEESSPKGATKNAIHLDVRLEEHDDHDAVAGRIAELGGGVLHHDWGDLPWRTYTDPSGNEFCLLPARG